MSYAKTLGIMLAVAVPALGLGACGGNGDGGGGGGGGGDTLSRSELAAKANPICNKAEADLKAVKEPSDIKDPSQAATYFRALQSIGDKASAELKALKPADDVKADYDSYLAAQDEGLRLIREIAKKAEARDRSGLNDVTKLGPLATKATAAAKQAGLTGCAD